MAADFYAEANERTRAIFDQDKAQFTQLVENLKETANKQLKDPYEQQVILQGLLDEESRAQSEDVYKKHKEVFDRLLIKKGSVDTTAAEERVKVNAAQLYDLSKDLLEKSGTAPRAEKKWLEDLSHTFEYLADYSTKDHDLGYDLNMAFGEILSLGKEASQYTSADHLLGVSQLFKPLLQQVGLEWDETASLEDKSKIFRNIRNEMDGLLDKERNRKIKLVKTSLEKQEAEGKDLSLRAKQFLAAQSLSDNLVMRIWSDIDQQGTREAKREKAAEFQRRYKVSADFINDIRNDFTRAGALSQEIGRMEQAGDIGEVLPFSRIDYRQDLIPSLIEQKWSESYRVQQTAGFRHLIRQLRGLLTKETDDNTRSKIEQQIKNLENKSISQLHEFQPSLKALSLNDPTSYQRYMEHFNEKVDKFIEGPGRADYLEWEKLSAVAAPTDERRKRYPQQMALQDITTWVENAEALTKYERSLLRMPYMQEIGLEPLSQMFGLSKDYIRHLREGRGQEGLLDLKTEQAAIAREAKREQAGGAGRLEEETSALDRNTEAQKRNARARRENNESGRPRPGYQEGYRKEVEGYVLDQFERSTRQRRDFPPTDSIKIQRMTRTDATQGRRFDPSVAFDFTRFVSINETADILDQAYKYITEGTEQSLGKAENILRNIYDQNIMPVTTREGLTADVFDNLYDQIARGEHAGAENEIKKILSNIKPETQYGRDVVGFLKQLNVELEQDQPDSDKLKEQFAELVDYTKKPNRAEFLQDVTDIQALLNLRRKAKDKGKNIGGGAFVKSMGFKAFRDLSVFTEDEREAQKEYEQRMDQMAHILKAAAGHKMTAKDLYQDHGEGIGYDRFFEEMQAMAMDPRSMIRYENVGGVDVFRSLLTQAKFGRKPKLNRDKAREIAFKLATGATKERLALDYSVSRPTIDQIEKRTYGTGGGWKYVWDDQEIAQIQGYLAEQKLAGEEASQKAKLEEAELTRQIQAKHEQDEAVRNSQKKIRDTHQKLMDLGVRKKGLTIFEDQLKERKARGEDVDNTLNQTRLDLDNVNKEINASHGIIDEAC